jgi:hypothetical protein
MKKPVEALERLREAESFIGSQTTRLFLDDANPRFRLGWLRSVRAILKANDIEPENLEGLWHT